MTARRVVARDIADREVVQKLFETIAPRYADRAGGYTRLLRLGYRRGDSAEVAQVELIGSEYNPNKAAKSARARTPRRQAEEEDRRRADSRGPRLAVARRSDGKRAAS